MADEQPNTPSAPAPSDAQSAAPSSESSAQEPEDRSWWHRLLRRPDPNVDAQASGDGTEAGSDGKSSQTVTLSQDELDRRVQAETDRREARRQQQQAVEQRRKLRDEDPYAYAQQEREAEQRQTYDQQYTNMLGQVGTLHDRAAIDPLVMALPESDRNRIMALEGAGVGLEGRTLVVNEALKALEKKWKAEGARDAEAKLRKNSAFRKQVFSEHRGAYPEPDLMPAAGAADGGADVSALLRRSIGRG